MQIVDSPKAKWIKSENYNSVLDKETGFFARWGKTQNENPDFGPLEIFDLEISTVCHGIPKKGSTIPVPCSFCYKSNTKVGDNMSLETFTTLFSKLPPTLGQIAFGIGDLDGNPDLMDILWHTRNCGVIPNITTNGYGLDDEWTKKLVEVLGAVAVSRYENKDICYDAVKKFTDAGMKQVNIHMVLSEESIDDCFELIDDAVTDPRLSKLNAIVFLTLKPKGKRNKWNPCLDIEKYKKLINYAFEKKVGIGMDSCGSKRFLMAVKDHPRFEEFSQMVESCESTLFSGYANVDGVFFPCSFTEGEAGWETGINLLEIEDWNKDVWFHPRVKEFRQRNLDSTDESICSDCRSCVTFPELYGTKKVIPILCKGE